MTDKQMFDLFVAEGNPFERYCGQKYPGTADAYTKYQHRTDTGYGAETAVKLAMWMDANLEHMTLTKSPYHVSYFMFAFLSAVRILSADSDEEAEMYISLILPENLHAINEMEVTSAESDKEFYADMEDTLCHPSGGAGSTKHRKPVAAKSVAKTCRKKWKRATFPTMARRSATITDHLKSIPMGPSGVKDITKAEKKLGAIDGVSPDEDYDIGHHLLDDDDDLYYDCDDLCSYYDEWQMKYYADTADK